MTSASDILITPSKSALSSIEKNVTCTEDGCSQTFVHTGAMNLHVVKTHGKFKNDADKKLFYNRKKNPSSPRIVYHCPELKCRYAEGGGKNFPKYSLLKQHYLKSHAEARYTCCKCDQKFSVESWRDRHQADCGTLFQCGSCPVKYTTRHVLHTHCKRHEHEYPEKYSREEAEAARMKRKTSKPTSKTIAMISVTPIVLVNMPPAKPKPSFLPKPIICKPPSEPNSAADKAISLQQTTSKTIRQDAMMQTDIYGISNLAVKGHELSSSQSVKGHELSSSQSVKGHELSSSLAVKGHELSSNTAGLPLSNTSTGNLVNAATSFEGITASEFPVKKSASAKRKLPIGSDQNMVSPPRRKKTKSTTGMQTSVSLTQKRRAQMISGTQTTGDYILRRAMAKADIPIERKTVASQVTPQKPKLMKNKMCSSETQTGDRVENFVMLDKDVGSVSRKPTLVDSFSQVKQRHIWAETSHNLAEQQTMTDLPPSISTQTLQSYLVNQQERTRLQKSRVGSVGMIRSDSGMNTVQVGTAVGDNETNFENAEHLASTCINKKGNSNSEHIVKMYNERLDDPVSIYVPSKSSNSLGKLTGPEKETKQVLDTQSPKKVLAAFENGKSVDSNTLVMTESGLKLTESRSEKEVREPAIQTIDIAKPKLIISSTSGILYNSAFPPYLNSSTSGANRGMTNITLTPTFTAQTNLPQNSVAMASDVAMATADTEAQTMSATEFESLLQSSGIFLDNADFIMDQSKLNQVESESQMTSSVMTSNIMTEPLGPEFDFLSSSHTIDMDTQTAFDFSLFDNCASIDTNTQTGTDVDFLDLVMTNMQTQTLNEDDLASLGLGGVCIDSQTSVGQLHTQSLGVGTSDLDFPDHGSHPVQSIISVSKKSACLNNQCTVSTNNPLLDSDTALNSQTIVGVRNQFVSNNRYHQNSQNQTTAGTSPLFDIDDSLEASKENQSKSILLCDPENQSQIKLPCDSDNQTQSKLPVDPAQSKLSGDPVQCKLPGDPAGSMTLTSLEMQTQTVGCDVTEPRFQTETQTQVDSRDTEYVTMETQTTTEDLEQLASWFD